MKSTELSLEQKALDILRAIAEKAADGKRVCFSEDWGFGTATVALGDGHSHIGSDLETIGDDLKTSTRDQNFETFVNDLHELLCLGRGLSFQPQNEIKK